MTNEERSPEDALASTAPTTPAFGPLVLIFAAIGVLTVAVQGRVGI